MPQRQVSTTHSTSTFTVSRERQKPASSIVKPTCMPNTRNAATSVHAVLTGLTMSAALTTAVGGIDFGENSAGQQPDNRQKQSDSAGLAENQKLPVSAPFRVAQSNRQPRDLFRKR